MVPLLGLLGYCQPAPKDVMFGRYVTHWTSEIMELWRSEGRKHDYRRILSRRLLQHFGAKTFEEINGVELIRYVNGMRHESGSKEGQPVSSSRILSILSVFRTIWRDARQEYGWTLSDPFEYLRESNRHGQIVPGREKNPPEVFRFDEWQAVLAAMDPFYQPIVEVMVLTGMIASELAGFRKADIADGEMVLRNSVVGGVEKQELKNR